MKRFLIHAAYKPTIILGIPIPFAEFMQRHVRFFMTGKKGPSLKEIEEAAKKLKVFGAGFSHYSTTEVDENYKQFDLPTPVADHEDK